MARKAEKVFAGQLGSYRPNDDAGNFGYLTLDKKRRDYLQYVKPALAILREVIKPDERWPFLSGDLITALWEDLEQNKQ